MAIEQIRPVRDPGYYLEEPSLTPPRWEGRGAKILGIEGRLVDSATFLNLYEGYSSDDYGNREKKLPSYIHPERRGMFDLSVNLPKDASVCNLVGNDRRIDGVFMDAVRAVAQDVERQAFVRARQKDGVEYKATNNLVWTVWDHPSSRAGDAHRHAHITFANLSYDGRKWKAVEFGHLDQQRLTDLFNKEMRTGLNKLGYKTERDNRSFRIVGFPWDVKTAFSQRHAGIKGIEADYEQKKGMPLTSKAKGKLSVIDRPVKPENKPLHVRQKEWLGRLSVKQLTSVKGVVRKAHRAVRSLRMKLSAQRYMATFRQPSYEPARRERSLER